MKSELFWDIYGSQNGGSFPTFRDNISVHIQGPSREPIGCPEMTVRD